MIEPNANYRNDFTDRGVTRERAGFRTFVADVIELFELQALLVKADARRASMKLKIGICLLMVGGIGMLSTLTLLLFGVAAIFEEQLDWSTATSQLVTALIAIVALGISTWVGAVQLINAAAAFRGSAGEFSSNLRAIKSALRQGVGRDDPARYEETLREATR